MLSKEFESEIQRVGEEAAKYVSENDLVFGASWDRKLDSTSITRAGNEAKTALSDRFNHLQENIGRICTVYLEMKEGEREEARQVVGEYPGLLAQLFNHLGWQAERIKSKADQKGALIGLAAPSLGDLRGIDTRDLLVAMGQVYLRLYRADVFLSMSLVRIAEISNPLLRPPRPTSMRDFLLNFEESAYFKNSVEPKLKEL